jgi:hypothetical protein
LFDIKSIISHEIKILIKFVLDIRGIDLSTSKNVNPVRSENREYYDITALRGGSFSVFCETKFDCSYHSYDFEFITNGIVIKNRNFKNSNLFFYSFKGPN